MAFDRNKFIDHFLQEAKKNVSRLNEGLLELEAHPDNKEMMDTIFRAAHTIKGSSRLMKYAQIGDVAHKLEDVLDSVRQGKTRLSKTISDLLFKGFDVIGLMLDKLAAGEDIEDYAIDICEKLENAIKNPFQEKDTLSFDNLLSNPPETVFTEESPPEPIANNAGDSVRSSMSNGASSLISIQADKLDSLVNIMGEIVNSQTRQKQRLNDIRIIENQTKHNLDLITRLGKKDNPDKEAFRKAKETADLLNQLVRQHTAAAKEDTMALEVLTSELQIQSLDLRMLPLSTIFGGLKRSVRDLAASFNKKIHFDIQGGDTELDKKIIDKLSDPLIHMIRNCIDHGIEDPEERETIGKSKVGTICLKGGYEGETVLIVISDDGRGIPVEKVKEKALQKKMCSASELKRMTQSETINLIFRAGLSTSELITDLSGRGVGMDVVRKNIIDELKGSIRVKTNKGRGTFFFIQLPLTLAVMRVLLVLVSNTQLAVPGGLVKEIVKIENKALFQMGNKKAIHWGEHIISVMHLGKILGLKKNTSSNEKDLLILVVWFENEYTGLIVDSLQQEQDMVIKPLPVHLKQNPWVAGCIIMSKTDIVNVLHMPNIIRSIRQAKVVHGSGKKIFKEKKRIKILVVDDSVSTREIEKNILESYGYEVSLAGDGVEALETLNKSRYDLIVTDVEMPRMDGFSLTQQLRRQEDYKDVPVILVTSLDRDEDKKKGIKVGANAYIIKGSFDQGNLLEAIQNLVG